jgi:hypothetical protein
MRSIWILTIGLVLIILAAGCITSPSAQNQVTTTVPTTSPSSLAPITTVQTTAEPISTATSLTVNTTSTIIPQTTQTQVQTDNPYINNLQFRPNVFYGHIHNCEMEEIFPTIAKDPFTA